MIKQLAVTISIAVLSLITIPANAITVFGDVDGDMIYDSNVTLSPGALLQISIYADVDTLHGGLAGFGVLMNFDDPPLTVNTVLSKIDNITIDPQWNFLATKSESQGRVTAGANILGSSLSGPAVHLFDVVFQAGANGTSIITMIDETAGFGDFAGADGFDYDISGELDFLSTQVTIVPIPPALLLFGSGLLGLIVTTRRRIGR